MNPPLFLHHAAQLLTLAGSPAPRRGRALGRLGLIEGGAVLTQGEQILGVGATRELAREAKRLHARPIDCSGRVVMPGFVDSHTHLVFAASRVEDFALRVSGKSYQEIAAAGGGIRYSARRLHRASPAELVRQATGFLNEMAAHGATTVEVKSGYGLDIQSELKILEAIGELKKHSPLELVSTLLAAHALPPAYQNRPAQFVDRIIRHLIPEVAHRKLAEFIDCFCERGAFGPQQCRQVLEAGARAGLRPRIHAEQLSHFGGTRLAIDLGATSADHLDHVTPAEIHALARSDVAATLVPGANFFLGLNRYAPARRLIDAGAVVALATDFNPGTCPCLNMQFILSLGSLALSMTPAESIGAATLNAAYALGRADRVGSIEPGKQADLAVMDVDDYRKIAYYFASNHCVLTVKRGRVIYEKPSAFSDQRSAFSRWRSTNRAPGMPFC
ncbi:MAG: imidazolonepropionase [Terriglobia bacterium]